MKLRIASASLIMMLASVSCFAFGFTFTTGGGWGQGVQSTLVDLLPSLAWSTNAWEFGSVDVGSTATKTFTITNSGNDIAEDVATTITGPGFRLYSSVTLGDIPSGGTRTAKVEFKPTAGGAFPGFLNYSAPNIGRTSVALSGVGVQADPYTKDFNNSFACSDGDYSSIVGACTTENAWASVAGTTDSSISGGKYVVTKVASSATSELLSTVLTARADTQLKFSVTPTAVTGAGQTVIVAQQRNGVNAQWSTSLVQTGSGTYVKWRVTYYNGSNVSTPTDFDYTFAAGHTYSVRLLTKCSTTTSSADGAYSLYVSDNGGTEQLVSGAVTGIDTNARSTTVVRLGIGPAGSVTNTWTFDNVERGWK